MILSHDFARKLLEGPNIPIAVPNVSAPDNDVPICDPDVEIEPAGLDGDDLEDMREHIIIVPKL